VRRFAVRQTASLVYAAAVFDPVSFLRERFVPLFERGVQILEERAAASESDRVALDDVRGFSGATRIDLDGTPRVWIAFDAGRVAIEESAPENARVRTALDLPSALAERWIGEVLLAAGRRSEEEAALAAARLVSKRTDAIVGDDPLEFHLVLTGTPEAGDATLRIGLGSSEPPAAPRFTATIEWSDLEAMRERGENLQQLFLAGKLRLAGDYSRALVLAMQLADSFRAT
jgi:hypothetical protein